ncbi:uncharacterized protein LOC122376200 [Amphibalanus amphitrite]|uniref:uncharacterized protein LOC122376200 n=1 Tax=Amphibalanus amphitrite TaxID=1232801 RepID=UPI001C92A12D|nr:uncharacterized protein LOC122376200 [Amphibalanus amphitrite]
MSWLLRNVTTLALCLPLLLLVLAHRCRASDPFAMFEFELTPEGGKDCCAAADRCHRLLDALGPLRARWATRSRCPARVSSSTAAPAPTPSPAAAGPSRPPSRHQLNSAFMQRHVKRTLKLLRIHEDVQPAERETFQLRGRISEVQVLRLRQFLTGSDHISLVETDAILEDIFADSEFESLLTEGQPRWLRQLRQLIPDVSTELVPLLLTVLLGSWLLVALLFGKSWTYVLSRMLVLVLVASFFWHWNHLYVRALAERHLQLNPPEGCEKGDRGWTDGLLHYVRGLVSFVKTEDKCREYYMRLHVDPFSEVSPGMALAETLTKMVLHPAEQCGRALGRFYVALGAEVPTIWMIPLTIISLGFFLALVVIGCRCRPPNSVSRDDSEALHVTVEPGQERVYLVVTASGEVQPVGAESRRRTQVQRAGPERVGWLAWTGRGLVRSVSAGALMAGGAVAGGTRALLNRRAPSAPPRSQQRLVAVEETAEDSPSRHGGGDSATPAREDRSTGEGPVVFNASESSKTEQTRPSHSAKETSPSAPGPDHERIPRSPMTSASPMTSSATAVDTSGGGDASSPSVMERRPDRAEVAPRGGGGENVDPPSSPFLTRIKEVMDTSLEDVEG